MTPAWRPVVRPTTLQLASYTVETDRKRLPIGEVVSALFQQRRSDGVAAANVSQRTPGRSEM